MAAHPVSLARALIEVAVHLTLSFALTIFSTAGFGDISAASGTARVVVTAQMILNLLILGSGIRLLTFAVRRGRQSQDREPAGF